MDKALPLHTIYAPNGDPYVSVVHDVEIVRIQLHNYDGSFKAPIYLNIDRRAIPELIKALSQHD